MTCVCTQRWSAGTSNRASTATHPAAWMRTLNAEVAAPDLAAATQYGTSLSRPIDDETSAGGSHRCGRPSTSGKDRAASGAPDPGEGGLPCRGGPAWSSPGSGGGMSATMALADAFSGAYQSGSGRPNV